MVDGSLKAKRIEAATDLVDIPAVGGGDHHVVRYLADDVQLLDRHLQRTTDPSRKVRKYSRNRTELGIFRVVVAPRHSTSVENKQSHFLQNYKAAAERVYRVLV